MLTALKPGTFVEAEVNNFGFFFLIYNNNFVAPQMQMYRLCKLLTQCDIYRLLPRKCAAWIFIHESQNFKNERVSF